MLSFIKKLFGSAVTVPAEEPAPYKVEAPAVPDFPVEKKPAKTAKPKAEKKPAAKAKTARKPRAPKA
jgi:sterol desaturase/sphingolipid hydroxylase (fatty acid hydroxylase superfamily)